MNRRGAVAVAVLAAWVVGAALFAKRELSRSDRDRLAEAAMRVSPGAAYYAVEREGRRIGFASSTIDTAAAGFLVTDYFVADVVVGGRSHRVTARSVVRMSRALALRDFEIGFESDSAPIRAWGRTHGDSLLEYSIETFGEVADTQRVALTGPILLPTLVPLAVALGERPAVGREYEVEIFDPMAMAPRSLSLRAAAESLFVVADSARLDPTTRRWQTAHVDTVRAWRLESQSASQGGAFGGWVDEQGRIVEVTQAAGFVLRRTAYEIAFENWRSDRPPDGAAVAERDDILETTAIAASALRGPRRAEPRRIAYRLSGTSLAGYDLESERQTLRGDTLVVEREPAASLRATYRLPADGVFRARFAAELAAEPLIQSTHPEIVATAGQIAARSRDPKNPTVVAASLARWVHQNIRKSITVSLPSAVQVLRARSGDCNEHTQLLVALARSVGIPARIAAGLAEIDGKFYYHAWPELYLGDWVAVDPTLDQFPAGAAHIRFVSGGLSEQAELLRLIGRLRIDVLSKE